MIFYLKSSTLYKYKSIGIWLSVSVAFANWLFFTHYLDTHFWHGQKRNIKYDDLITFKYLCSDLILCFE